MFLSPFSSTPSSPTWVPPPSHTFPPPPPANPLPTPNLPSLTGLSPTAAALRKASHDLEQLSLSRSSSTPSSPPTSSSDDVTQIQTFLSEWRHPLGPRTGEIQLNALAWFNASRALEYAVRAKRGEVVRVLLDVGLAPNERAVSAAAEIMVDGEENGIERDVEVGKTMLGWMLKKGVDEGAGHEGVVGVARYFIHSPTLLSYYLSLLTGIHPSTHPFIPSPSLFSLFASKSPLSVFKLLVSYIPTTTTTPTLYFPKDILPQTVLAHATSGDRLEVIEYLVGECGVSVEEGVWEVPEGLKQVFAMYLGNTTNKREGAERERDRMTALEVAEVYGLSDVEEVLSRKR